jgi:hypothetical protein
MTIYNQLDFKTSRLYEYSKTEKEGFEEHVNTVGTKSYRKYQNSGVTGTLANVSVKESKIGDQLNITLRDEDGNYLQNQFSLYDQNGFVDNNFCEGIISKLRNMKKGEIYTIYTWILSPEDQRSYDEDTQGREVRAKYYDRRGVSIKCNGQRVDNYIKFETDDRPFVEGGNVSPKIQWVDNKAKPGKKKKSAASSERRSDFFIMELMNAVDGHLAYDDTKAAATAAADVHPSSAAMNSFSGPTEDYDELPF